MHTSSRWSVHARMASALVMSHHSIIQDEIIYSIRSAQIRSFLAMVKDKVCASVISWRKQHRSGTFASEKLVFSLSGGKGVLIANFLYSMVYHSVKNDYICMEYCR